MSNSFIETMQWVGGVIARHANKLAIIINGFFQLSNAMQWTTFTVEQSGAIGIFTVAVLGAFVESTTVSKQRMGERVEEVKVAEQVKSDAKVEAAVAIATGTGSGVFRP